MDHLCIVSQRQVTRRQHARPVGGEFSWHCQDCSRDDLNETVAYEEPMQVPEEPEDIFMLRPEEVELRSRKIP